MLHPLIPDPLLKSLRVTMFESDRVCCDLPEKEQADEPAETGLKSE